MAASTPAVTRTDALRDALIAPSLLSADFARLGEEVRDVVDARADVISFHAGADTFVAGSAISGQSDYRAVIEAMRAELAR